MCPQMAHMIQKQVAVIWIVHGVVFLVHPVPRGFGKGLYGLCHYIIGSSGFCYLGNEIKHAPNYTNQFPLTHP